MIPMHTTVVIAATLIAGLLVMAAETPAAAQDGTPPATPTATVALLNVSFPLSSDEPVVRWERVAGAAQYQLTGTFRVVRINAADPFCTSPLASDSRTLTLDEQLNGDATEFLLPLPDLPPEDDWFIWESRAELYALDGDGQVIAAGGGLGIAETTNFIVCATTTPPRVLPPTGSGGGGGPASLAWLAIALSAAGLAAFRSVRNEIKRRREETLGDG